MEDLDQLYQQLEEESDKQYVDNKELIHMLFACMTELHNNTLESRQRIQKLRDEIGNRILMNGKSFESSTGGKVTYVKGRKIVKWNDEALMTLSASVPKILAYREEKEGKASLRWTVKEGTNKIIEEAGKLLKELRE